MCPMATAMVSTVSPNAKATPNNPIPTAGIAAANTARHVEELIDAAGFRAFYSHVAARAAARPPTELSLSRGSPRHGPLKIVGFFSVTG